MELSCFSSLALTPSAWLTGDEHRIIVKVLFGCNMIKGERIIGETIGEKNLPAKLEDNKEYQRKTLYLGPSPHSHCINKSVDPRVKNLKNTYHLGRIFQFPVLSPNVI